MSLFEDTNPRDLKQLLDQIQSGDAVLPAFSARIGLGTQRDAGSSGIDRVELPSW